MSNLLSCIWISYCGTQTKERNLQKINEMTHQILIQVFFRKKLAIDFLTDARCPDFRDQFSQGINTTHF